VHQGRVIAILIFVGGGFLIFSQMTVDSKVSLFIGLGIILIAAILLVVQMRKI
jgi:hypothetical protein